jgi:hypothetical protein
MPQRPQPSLRLADGGNFVTRWAQNVMRPKNTEQRLREIEAPPPAPVARPAPPPPPPPPPNATPDNPAGIRFQDGGHVPGTGEGDKIPAKYEPGEFVVSNDMIDDNPGLREQLSGLRAETLAARGKTVEEADAKALRYHGGLRGGGTQGARHTQVSLRAIEGFPGVDVFERPMTADEAARFRPDEAAAHANNVNPKLTPNNPAFHGEGRYGAPPNPTAAAPAAPTPVANTPTTLRTVASGVGNALMYGGAGVGGALAAKGLSDVGAPKGTAAVPGERQSGDSASSMQIPTGGYGPGPVAQPYNFWTDSEAGRNIGNAANAIAPLGGVAMAARVPGAASKAFGLADAAVTGLAVGVRDERASANTAPDLRNPYADANAAKIAASDAQPAAAAAAAPDTPTSSPGLPTGVFKHGRGQYSDSASGMGMPTGFTGQPSAQNDAILQRMADRSQAESAARVQGGMGGGGGGSAPQMPQAPTVRHSGNDWQARNDLRNAQVSASSIMNNGGKWDQHKGVSPERAYAAALEGADIAARHAQPGVDVATLQSNNSLRGSLASADASRYGSDNSLRGQVYSADSTRAGQMATARSKQQELAYNRQRDALKDSRDAEQHSQTVGHNADSNARKDTQVFGPDDKVNEGMSAARYDVANQLFPGYGQMDEASRKAINPDVKEMLGIFDRTYENKQMGFSKLNPLDPRDPKRSAMPNFQGGTLKKQGPEGYLTPGGEMGGHYVTDAEGNDIPLGKLNERQIELVKRQIKTGSWTDKKEGK